MTTPKTTFAGLALIAALCAGFTLDLTAPAWAGSDERTAAAQQWYRETALLRVLGPLAEQGNARAQFMLGLMYDNGRDIRQDYAKALQWYRKAAEQGHAKAQYFLGSMYDEGLGVPEDYAEAMKWYRKAAKQGNAYAQNSLGVMYAKGQGVPRDYVQALMWFNLAASRFPPGEDRDTAVKNHDIFAKTMTPAQIPEAQKLAREWTEKHGK